MKSRFLLVSSLCLMIVPLIQSPSQANSSRFFCARLNQVWTTFVNSTQGKVPLIQWVSGDFDASGWSNKDRCITVSDRFNRFNNEGQLYYLKTGKVNNLPVICGVKANQGQCSDSNVLVTLKAGMDAEETLKQLLATRDKITGNPISLSDDEHIYSYDQQGELTANMDKLINALSPVSDQEIQEIQSQPQLQLQPTQTQPETESKPRIW